MKLKQQNIFLTIIPILFVIGAETAFSQGVGINTDGSTPAAMLHVKSDDANSNTVTDLLILEHTTSGASTAAIGNGLNFLLEDAGGSEIQARVDLVMDVITNNSEDATFKFTVNKVGTLTEIMRLDGTLGYMGVGAVTAPTYLVSLEGNAARTIGMERHTTNNTAGNNLTLQAGGATIGATDKSGGELILSSGIAQGAVASKMSFYTATPQAVTSTTDNTPTLKMTLAATGNLGFAASLGATNPLELYSVVTTGNSTGHGTMMVTNSSTNYGPEVWLQSTSETFKIGSGQTLNSAGVGSFYIYDLGCTCDRMVINSSGQVGFGTSSPSSLLHVRYASAVTNAVSAVFRLDHKNAGGAPAAGFGIRDDYYLEDAAGNTNQAATIDVAWEDATNASEDASIRFSTMQAGALTAAMRIDDTGNIGIGTTTPGQKLEVNGNIKATTFISTTAGAGAYVYNTASNMNVPDYVFESYFDHNKKNNPEYKMLSLPVLKSFVKTNKHLPRVPSRAALLKDGAINLQAISMLTLEKIEENTLYILELDKQINSSNKQIKQLIKQSEKNERLLKEQQEQINEIANQLK